MHYVAGVEIVETFQYLDNIAGYQSLVELPESLQGLREGTILRVSEAEGETRGLANEEGAYSKMMLR